MGEGEAEGEGREREREGRGREEIGRRGRSQRKADMERG